MNRKTTIIHGCLLAALALGLADVSAAGKAETDPKHQLPRPDGKVHASRYELNLARLIPSLRKDYNALGWAMADLLKE
jgi:hypothetical protein